MNQLILETSLILVWFLLVGQLQASELCIRAHFTLINPQYKGNYRTSPETYLANSVKSCNITIIHWADMMDRRNNDSILSVSNAEEANFRAIYSERNAMLVGNQQYIVYYRGDQFTAIYKSNYHQKYILGALEVQFHQELDYAPGSQKFMVIIPFMTPYTVLAGARFAAFIQETMANVETSSVAVIGNYRPVYIDNTSFKPFLDCVPHRLHGNNSPRVKQMSALLLKGMVTANVTYVPAAVGKSPFRGNTLQLTISTEEMFHGALTAPVDLPDVVTTGHPVQDAVSGSHLSTAAYPLSHTDGSRAGSGGIHQKTWGEPLHLSETIPASEPQLSTSYQYGAVGQSAVIDHDHHGSWSRTPPQQPLLPFQRRTSVEDPGEIRRMSTDPRRLHEFPQSQSPVQQPTSLVREESRRQDADIRDIAAVSSHTPEANAYYPSGVSYHIYPPQQSDQHRHRSRSPVQDRQTSAVVRHTERFAKTAPILRKKQLLAIALKEQTAEDEHFRQPQLATRARVTEHVETSPQHQPLDLTTRHWTAAPQEASVHVPYDPRGLQQPWIPHS